MSEEKAPAPEQAPAGAAPEAAAGNKKQKLLMYGLIGGGVLLIIISVVVGFLLSRGHDAPAAGHEAKPAEEGHGNTEGEHKKEEGHAAPAEHGTDSHSEPGHEAPKAAEHAAPTAEGHGAESTGHGATDEASLKAEAEKLKAEVGQLQLDVQKQSEMLTLSDEASKLKFEIEELKAKKAALEGDKTKIAEGVKQIRSGEKKCVMSGDPSKRMEELRACLGLSGAASGGHGASSASSPAAGHAGPHWSYSGETGPEYWAKLNPEWKLCSAGRTQSPINLVGSYPKGAPSLSFGYKPGAMAVVNNGHTIQVNLKEAGGVELSGKRYNLVQFHFHTPSEEQVNGRPADMVMHMVHKSDDGKLLVVGLLLNKGKDNAVLKGVFESMPKEEGAERPLEAKFDAAKVLPANKSFYHFEGSLTTPPCSEGVQWFVLKDQGNVSLKQFAAYTSIYAYNARPIQATNGRKIVEP